MAGKKRIAKNANEGPPSKKVRPVICDLPIPSRSNISGEVFTCGQGEVGQLGLGPDLIEKTRPTSMQVKNVVDICAGGMHSLYLTDDGEVYSFGCNDEGALGRDTSTEDSEFTPTKIQLPKKAIKISAGDSHSACLLENGSVYAWGSFRDSHGSMGLTAEGIKKLPFEMLPGIVCVDIASGADHLVILTKAGRVYTVGCGEQGQLGRVTLRSASGDSRRGKTELLNPMVVSVEKGKYVDAIWATTYCTFVKKFNSQDILGFGLNNYRQLGVRSSKELITTPNMTKFKDVKKICGGQHHTLILTNQNKCFVIGRKDYGRLGLGEIENDVTEPTEIPKLSNEKIIDICCGESQSFAITEQGSAYAWGMGSSNQLGTGDDKDQNEPVVVKSKSTLNKKFVKIKSGGQHSIFLVETDNSIKNSTTLDSKSTNMTKKTTMKNINTNEESCTIQQSNTILDDKDAGKNANNNTDDTNYKEKEKSLSATNGITEEHDKMDKDVNEKNKPKTKTDRKKKN